jgi:hypothetical protein
MKRITKSETNVTGAQLAHGRRQLGEQHAETRWTLTAAGASYLAGQATAEYLDDPSLEGAARMEARYQLAERLGYWEGQR